MDLATRKTRACTLDTLDEELKADIRAHGAMDEATVQPVALN